MSNFNFDPSFFRSVISKCKKTEKITSLSHMTQKAIEVFYEEFDYYPDISVFAPGTFTIMGDHLEYVKGNLVQAALPLGAVIVGKSLSSVKCKVITTSKNVQGLGKSVFPVSHFKKNEKVFPEWVNYIQGIISNFPDQHINGFDAVIYSNVPFCQGYGSSAALQVGFYTFLEAATGRKTCKEKCAKKRKKEIGKLCALSESKLELCKQKLGRWSCLTSSFAEVNTCVKVNCRTDQVSTFDMRDLNVGFLLTYPKFEIERKDRDLINWRKMELFVAAKLLELKEIIDATDDHLTVLENMEDPTKDTVRTILREMGKKDESIEEFIEDLFFLPSVDESSANDLGSEGEFMKEEVYQEINFEAESAKESEKSVHDLTKSTSTVSYFHERLAELCAGKTGCNTGFPERICDEINCLGGFDNLSTTSKISVCGKLLKRVRHIITENTRCQTLCDFTSQLDYEELGVKLIQSHLSLKVDYDVSCPTLDNLVQLAIDTDRVYGAKMTSGGGTLTLLHRNVVEKFVEKITEKYGENFQFYLVFPSSGAKILKMNVKKNPTSNLSNVFLNRDELLKKAVDNFEATYKYRPTHGTFSPGVFNLIGDHTDYNHGFCISLASNMLTVVVGALNGTSKIRVVTTADVDNETQKVIFPVPKFDPIRPGNIKWARLVKSVVGQFHGMLRGFDCLIQSALPCGSGISSKTALVLSLYKFMEVLGEEKPISNEERAYQCMLAVQDFSKTVCGVSDFLVAEKSKEDFVVLVDSWNTSTTLVPFHDPSVTLVLTVVDVVNKCNRALLYVRMEECYDVARALGAKSLRCLTLRDLNEMLRTKKNIPEQSVRRAVHIVSENERVLKAAEALKNNDFDLLGELMVASHNSLKDNYEITIPELDNLVASAMEVDGVFGSKMPFNGCVSSTLTLVKRWATDDLIDYLQKSTTRRLNFYVLSPYECCNKLNVKEFVDTLPSPQFVFEDIFPL